MSTRIVHPILHQVETASYAPPPSSHSHGMYNYFDKILSEAVFDSEAGVKLGVVDVGGGGVFFADANNDAMLLPMLCSYYCHRHRHHQQQYHRFIC